MNSSHTGESVPTASTGSRLSTFHPLALVVAIVGYHGFEIVAHDDDPQRSGAFAMFATVDIGATRQVIATTEDGAVTLKIPASLKAVNNDLADRPSEEAASGLASMLLDHRWDVRSAVASAGGTEVLDEIRIQVVGLDTEGRTVFHQILQDVTVRAGP